MNKRHSDTALEENKTVEFKETWSDEALRTLAAFANTDGGTLFVGVNDQGQSIGWKGSRKQLDGITNQIVDKLRLHPSVEIKAREGQEIVVIGVLPTMTPTAFSGRYYHRVGGTTREIPPENLGRFFINRMGVKWDGLPGDYDLEEIDRDTFRNFVSLAKNRLSSITRREPMETTLRKLDLIRDGKLTRAAILLFGKNPQHHFLMAQVHMGRFKDGLTIIDDQLIRGNLFQQLDQIMMLFQKYLHVRYDFHKEIGNKPVLKAMQRIEVWDYPLDALREAVLNALIHRDYFDANIDIQVRVYEDHISITNPGGLPQGISIEDLRRQGHPSVPRNPLLAQVFYYAEYIEKWGGGTSKMLELCQKQDLPEPAFKSDQYFFNIQFDMGIYSEERLWKMGLNERQIKAIRWIKEKGSITNTDYQKLTGTKHRTAALELGVLSSKGIVVKIGRTGRGTNYTLANVRNVQ